MSFVVIKTILFALVQAVTEFWPVSSSGHLVILHEYIDFSVVDTLTFDVALHVGTALALIIFFWKDIVRYAKAFFALFRHPNLSKDDQKTTVNLIIATIPAALAGFYLESYIESWFRSVLVVAITLILGGILFFIVEKYTQKKRDMEALSLPEAFGVGLAQALALIPGVSRSGITIVTGMAMNLKRDEAARFSFLLSIPVVLGAGLKKFLDLDMGAVSIQELYLFALGGVISFLAGYVVIKYFLQFLKGHSLRVFGWYRILLGLILLVMLYI